MRFTYVEHCFTEFKVAEILSEVLMLVQQVDPLFPSASAPSDSLPVSNLRSHLCSQWPLRFGGIASFGLGRVLCRSGTVLI